MMRTLLSRLQGRIRRCTVPEFRLFRARIPRWVFLLAIATVHQTLVHQSVYQSIVSNTNLLYREQENTLRSDVALDGDTGIGFAATVSPSTSRSFLDSSHSLKSDWAKPSRQEKVSRNPAAGGEDWLDMFDFDVYLDAFSNSWYMNIDLLLEAESDMGQIESPEQASFFMFKGRTDRVRMSLDWLDWSVEHMSKWWKVLDVPRDAYGSDRVSFYLDEYRRNSMRSVPEYEPYRSLLGPTIALIAFQQYEIKRGDDESHRRSRELTVASLAATISSLVRVGMGRILVVGHDRERAEEELVRAAFDRFPAASANSTLLGSNEWIGSGTQLVYVTVPDELVRTDSLPVNMPRGALLGLHRALVGNDTDWTTAWLGRDDATATHAGVLSSENLGRWSFVYLTEPDTLLHTRPTTLPILETMLRQGLILAPHRLQPIPYEADVPESTLRHTFLSAEAVALSSAAPSVIELDPVEASCCDEQRRTHRPGPETAGAYHGWWSRGFSKDPSRRGNHSLILNYYRLVRLRQGTGVAILAGSAHGRRCIPSQNGTGACVRRKVQSRMKRARAS